MIPVFESFEKISNITTIKEDENLSYPDMPALFIRFSGDGTAKFKVTLGDRTYLFTYNVSDSEGANILFDQYALKP